MAKQGAKTAVPRLRFPEFRGSEGWHATSLGQVTNLITKGTTPTSIGFQFVEQGINFIKIESINDGSIDLSKVSAISEECHEALKRSQLRRGDLLFSIAGALGVTAVVKDAVLPANTNQALAIIRLKNGQSLGFIEKYLTTPAIESEVEKIRSGAAQPNISLTQVGEFSIALPLLSEQQKVADCLTSLDEVIAAQGRKVEALKTHKRGLMQQLFPREGETRPRLRFPDFRDGQEWIARPLGELMVIGSSRRVHESDWTTTGVPFYRAREIVALAKGEPITPLFISETLYREFSGYTGEIEGGQLLVTGVGSIGIPYLVKSGDRFYFKDGNIIWLKNDQAELTGNFLLRLFESEYVQGQIATMAGVGTVGTYTIDNARRTIVVFPTDKREQQRIADCLSSLDTQITAESNQLAALKTHKQGLMQQLFPAPEAATA